MRRVEWTAMDWTDTTTPPVRRYGYMEMERCGSLRPRPSVSPPVPVNPPLSSDNINTVTTASVV